MHAAIEVENISNYESYKAASKFGSPELVRDDEPVEEMHATSAVRRWSYYHETYRVL